MNFEKALNLFFPIKCGVCGKIGLPICNKCEEIIKKHEINLTNKELFNTNIEIKKYLFINMMILLEIF